MVKYGFFCARHSVITNEDGSVVTGDSLYHAQYLWTSGNERDPAGKHRYVKVYHTVMRVVHGYGLSSPA